MASPTDHPRDIAPQRIEWQGQSWFVADAQHDLDDAHPDEPGHWHLTLTAPQPPRRKRCGHDPNVSVTGCRYCAATFVAAVAEKLGVEPPEQTRKVLDG